MEPNQPSKERRFPAWLQAGVFLLTGVVVIAVLGARWVQTPWSLEEGLKELAPGMSVEEVRDIMGRESDGAEGLLVWWTKSTGGSPQEGIRRIQGTELSVTYAAWFEEGKLVEKRRFEAYVSREVLERRASPKGD